MSEEGAVHMLEIVQGEGDRSRYQLDMEALERMLLHPDVADLPVAPVSVAGKRRWGKSFILDYQLRYLKADEEARADGSWLGAPDEPLVGFTWEGGLERVTTGLLLWSRPLRAVSSTGEPVAVLLMDTQGTFDTQTTTRDCTTIFALSTLIASVQIYNLHRDIGEDDLQHLQMFTEHGKMALERNHDHKPFQRLMFLIRDFAWSHQLPYGAEGGRALLDRRVTNGVAKELKEVREYIHACFEPVDCFLMPHPGFAVEGENFDGSHSGVTEAFKQQLLRFVPYVFEPRNLPVKMIDGTPVTCRDLLAYIRTYVDLFNSEEIPEPMSIVRANKKVAMLTSMEAAQRQYASVMEGSCGERGLGRPPAVVRALHEAARNAALETFRTRADGLHDNLQTLLDQLKQTLDGRRREFEQMNETKHLRTVADCNALYESEIELVTENKPLCLNPPDLENLHDTAKRVAVDLFDSRRSIPEGYDDKERAEFLKNIHDKLRRLQKANANSNNAAVDAAVSAYSNHMGSVCGPNVPSVGRDNLNKNHEEARQKALNQFRSKRTLDKEVDETDEYRLLVIEKTNELYEQYKLDDERKAKLEKIQRDKVQRDINAAIAMASGIVVGLAAIAGDVETSEAVDTGFQTSRMVNDFLNNWTGTEP